MLDVDFRTFGLSDFRTFGPMVDGRMCVLQIMKARHGSGGHRPPPRWQVTVSECRECPVQRTPSGSFRAHATSANHLARVARASRVNGHTAIAGGRCLDAGIMPPPSSLSITRSPVRLLIGLTFVCFGLADLRTCGLSDLRTAAASILNSALALATIANSSSAPATS